MFPVLQIGSVVLPVPTLALLIGVLAGIWLAEKEAARLKLPAEAVSYLILISLGAGLIGARLGYVARYLSIYAADPLAILSPSGGALVPEVGFLLAGVAALIYGHRRALPLQPTLDALAPGLAMMGMALGVAHLASGDAFGAPAHLPWSIYLWSAYRHPSQIYEILAALVVLLIWWLARLRLPAAGFGFLLVVALSAAARIFLEAFRGDSQVLAGGLRAPQVWGLLVLGLCLIAAHIWSRGTSEGARAPAWRARAKEE
jgi:phosphatidylglycerol---prolipoprotein diacylglyceryl transferase